MYEKELRKYSQRNPAEGNNAKHLVDIQGGIRRAADQSVGEGLDRRQGCGLAGADGVADVPQVFGLQRTRRVPGSVPYRRMREYKQEVAKWRSNFDRNILYSTVTAYR